MPRVSVIIPTYNRQDLVRQTIDSVLRQTFTDWELIVVDDGSTDDSRRVLSETYGTRIRYVCQDNQGESAARNHGVELSAGEYVAFVDSDDLWHRDKLQRQVDAFQEFPNAGLVTTQAYWIDHGGMLLKKPPHGHDRATPTISWQDLVLDNVVAGGGSAAMVRRACLDRVGGFDPRIRFGEEWDLWLRIARHYQLRQLPEPLTYYRLHRFGTRGWAPRPLEAETMYGEHRAILDKAFADCPLEHACCEELRAKALSRIYLRQAIVDCALGKAASGREHWLAAIRLCPQYAAHSATNSQQIVHFVTGYASVADADIRIAEIGRILDEVLDSLPSEVLSLKAQRNSLWSRCLAEMAFLAALNKDRNLARHAACRCLLADPTWTRNRGLLKIVFTGGRHLWPEPISL